MSVKHSFTDYVSNRFYNEFYIAIDDVAIQFQAIIEDRGKPKCERIVDGYTGFLYIDKDGYPLVAMYWEHRFNHMVWSGMNPKTLQYLMGHSEIGVTMNTYTHLGLEDAQDELRRMEELERARREITDTCSGTA